METLKCKFSEAEIRDVKYYLRDLMYDLRKNHSRFDIIKDYVNLDFYDKFNNLIYQSICFTITPNVLCHQEIKDEIDQHISNIPTNFYDMLNSFIDNLIEKYGK